MKIRTLKVPDEVFTQLDEALQRRKAAEDILNQGAQMRQIACIAVDTAANEAGIPEDLAYRINRDTRVIELIIEDRPGADSPISQP